MGKLTAEQKVREYNRGQKAAREGRSRSWSEPWAYPFESDQHYEERREAQPGLWNNRRHTHVCPAISSVITVKPSDQRSISPNTMSSEPMIAETSASMCPRLKKSIACRWANDGARILHL